MASRVNDRLVADMAARLRDGGLRFGPHNLYYAVCAVLEGPDVKPGAGLIVLGVVLLVVTLVVGILAASFFIWPLLPVGMAVTGFGLRARRQARVLPTTRALALGYEEFVDGVVAPRRGTALLEGMGYATSPVSKPGADGGTDILAYIDPLGAQTPHIRVQVKHRDQTASREDVAALRGIIRGDREIGLFVSSGGFSREARREAGHGAVHIELVDLDRFLELWLQHYSKIPEVKRSKLRLEPIHFLAVVSLT